MKYLGQRLEKRRPKRSPVAASPQCHYRGGGVYISITITAHSNTRQKI
ncbi:Hypothetical protein ETEE_2648 [Edwardsiella anguillarum ET080813]|uniref:Uncharacterized protein n=1 Tax=Edwardsiella anguillarum ET080813 TaxID=667120 RepID=A0A076LQY6_9GAMM|nr:Hypothetical protein ETEE_2648 [Edwardsiella anguillarum ET080813]